MMKSLPMKSFYTLLLMLGIALSQPIAANPISAQQAKQNAVIDRIIGGSGDCLSNLMSDVNSGGEVNIADINTVINLILNK